MSATADAPDFQQPYAWLVRPCSYYKSELEQCRTWYHSFHSRYTTGEVEDCAQWQRDYQNCLRTLHHDSEAFEALVGSEKRRRLERLRAAAANDVWEYRDCAPAHWNAPPENADLLSQGDDRSVLDQAQKEIDNLFSIYDQAGPGKDENLEKTLSKSSCVML